MVKAASTDSMCLLFLPARTVTSTVTVAAGLHDLSWRAASQGQRGQSSADIRAVWTLCVDSYFQSDHDSGLGSPGNNHKPSKNTLMCRNNADGFGLNPYYSLTSRLVVNVTHCTLHIHLFMLINLINKVIHICICIEYSLLRSTHTPIPSSQNYYH